MDFSRFRAPMAWQDRAEVLGGFWFTPLAPFPPSRVAVRHFSHAGDKGGAVLPRAVGLGRVRPPGFPQTPGTVSDCSGHTDWALLLQPDKLRLPEASPASGEQVLPRWGD